MGYHVQHVVTWQPDETEKPGWRMTAGGSDGKTFTAYVHEDGRTCTVTEDRIGNRTVVFGDAAGAERPRCEPSS